MRILYRLHLPPRGWRLVRPRPPEGCQRWARWMIVTATGFAAPGEMTAPTNQNDACCFPRDLYYVDDETLCPSQAKAPRCAAVLDSLRLPAVALLVRWCRSSKIVTGDTALLWLVLQPGCSAGASTKSKLLSVRLFRVHEQAWDVVVLLTSGRCDCCMRKPKEKPSTDSLIRVATSGPWRNPIPREANSSCTDGGREKREHL